MSYNQDALLCAREEFPYDDEILQKVIDREQTIRLEWIASHDAALESGKEASRRGTEQGALSQQQPIRYMAVEYLPKALLGVASLLNKLEAHTARKDKQYIQRLNDMPWMEFVCIAFTVMVDSAIRRDNIAAAAFKVASACEREARWKHYHTQAPRFFEMLLEQQHKNGNNTDHITKALTVAMNRYAAGVYDKDNIEHPEVEFSAWEQGNDSFHLWLGFTFIDIICQQTGLFEKRNDSGINTTKRLYVTELFENFVNATQTRIGMFGGEYMSLPVPPRNWTTTQCGGFWTNYAGQKKLVKNYSKGYQEELLNMSEEYGRIVFPAVNAAQHTAWRINKRILEVMQTLSDNNKMEIAGMPACEDKPIPVCPKCGKVPEIGHICFIDPDKEKKEKLRAKLEKQKAEGKKVNIFKAIEPNKNETLKAWKIEAADVHSKNTSRVGRRILLKNTIETAELLADDERFYYVYQTDFRGRMYPCGNLTPQGTDWQKGLLQFADGVALGEHGAKWLAIHLANTWANDGIDKKSYKERVDWVNNNAQMIINCGNHPLDCPEWMDAEEPFCFLAACMEWAEYSVQGNTYESHIAVALDGSCSGIQHYSAMLRDEVGAIATNVKCLDPNKGKNDIYGQVAAATVKLMEKDIADAENGAHAALLIPLMNRKIVKRSVMTLPYGSKYQSCADYVEEELMKKLPKLHKDAQKDRKMKIEICKYAAKKVWAAIPMVVQAAREGMNYLQRLANLFSDSKNPITWITPSGFVVQQSYFSMQMRIIKTMTGGTIIFKKDLPVWKTTTEEQISIASYNDREINPTRQVSGIAPNFVHSLDASHLMMSVKRASEQGIHDYALIHDSLGTHAGKTEEFSELIRDTFFRLYDENNPLEEITEHLLHNLEYLDPKKIPDMPHRGALNLEDVKQAIYLFS